jgi:hypothetical protein
VSIATVVSTFGAIFVLGPCVAAAVVFRTGRFRSLFASEKAAVGNGSRRGCTKRALTPAEEWVELDAATRSLRLRQFGAFFDAHTDRAPWFYFFEVAWVNVGGSVAASLATIVSCTIAAWLCFAVYVVFVATLLCLRPYSAPVDMILQTAVAVMQTIALAVAAYRVSTDDGGEASESIAARAVQTAAETCATVASALVTLLAVVEVTKVLYRRCCRQGESQRRARNNESEYFTEMMLEMSPESLERLETEERLERRGIESSYTIEVRELTQAEARDREHAVEYWAELRRRSDKLVQDLYGRVADDGYCGPDFEDEAPQLKELDWAAPVINPLGMKQAAAAPPNHAIPSVAWDSSPMTGGHVGIDDELNALLDCDEREEETSDTGQQASTVIQGLDDDPLDWL